VVLNPPFGTRQSGIDVCFLHVALQLSRSAVYSLHKTSTRAFIAALCLQWGVKGEVVAEMQFELKRSYSWHKEQARDVQVDLWRLAFWDEQHRPDRFTAGSATRGG
jgi:predicted RNA methylase